jgi:glycosyltransferase involved in cell wall biosynthesis
VPNLEIIVADDGSTDDTAAVAAATDLQARYVWQPNSGTPATARNRGFALSRGRYVAFLDCDDEWLPDAPAHAVALLDRYPEVDVLFADAQMGNRKEGFRSWIEVAGQEAFFALPHEEPEAGFRILDRRSFLRRMAVRNPVFIGAVIMRREAFERAGMFDVELRGAADWELWLRLASQMTYAFWSEPLAIYTRHEGGMSNDHDSMRGEFCLSLQKILHKCSWLEREDRCWIERSLYGHMFGFAYQAYDRGDYREARLRFARYLRRFGLEARGSLYWSLCCLPFGLAGTLRKMKWRLAGDG